MTYAAETRVDNAATRLPRTTEMERRLMTRNRKWNAHLSRLATHQYHKNNEVQITQANLLIKDVLQLQK